MSALRFGTGILARHEALAAITEGEGCLTRTYLTAKHREAGELIAGWMREAGMAAGFDAMGNLVGRYAGATADAPVLMTGSHMDTVVDAGKYDGSFGILSPIACVADLHARGKRLPHAIEVVAFGDEEGVASGQEVRVGLAEVVEGAEGFGARVVEFDGLAQGLARDGVSGVASESVGQFAHLAPPVGEVAVVVAPSGEVHDPGREVVVLGLILIRQA